MGRISRLLRHRWFDETDARRALDDAALRRIAERVAESERHHSGEIRVCVEPGLPLSYLWRGAGARERALSMFGKLRVWDTEHNNGVLVYLLLADHAIEVVADRGVHRRVGESGWQAVVQSLSADLRRGEIEAGLLHAVDTLDGVLRRHFPLTPGEANPNELPDAPWRA